METEVLEVEKIESEVLSIATVARDVSISDHDGYENAGGMLKAIKGKKVAIESIFGPIKKASFAAHKANLSAQKKLENPLTEAESILKSKMIQWDNEQEKIRREEQARLEAEARKRDEEIRLSEAIEAEERGNVEEANSIMEETVVPDEIVLPKATPKIPGLSFSTTYSAEVVNLKLIIKTVFEGKVPLVALKANEVFLNQQARALKESFNYPGVKLVKKKSMSAGWK